jgi:hypothetical protein
VDEHDGRLARPGVIVGDSQVADRGNPLLNASATDH